MAAGRGYLEGSAARRHLRLHDSPDFWWAAIQRCKTLRTPSRTVYNAATTDVPPAYLVPGPSTQTWRVGIEVFCASERHPYKGGAVVAGTIYHGGVTAKVNWDDYLLEILRPTGERRSVLYLNYSPASVTANRIIRSVTEVRVVGGETIRLKASTNDGITAAVQQDPSREGFRFAPMPNPGQGWECGVLVRLTWSP